MCTYTYKTFNVYIYTKTVEPLAIVDLRSALLGMKIGQNKWEIWKKFGNLKKFWKLGKNRDILKIGN